MSNFYRTRRNEFGKTHAILDDNNNIVMCDWRTALKWRNRGGDLRSELKVNRICGWDIHTRFRGESSALDGPHLFWVVTLHRYVPGARRNLSLAFRAHVDGLLHLDNEIN